MCFHWKSLLRQIRIIGKINLVTSYEADKYYESRAYGSRIGAWASKQSTELTSMERLHEEFRQFELKFSDKIVPTPTFWGGFTIHVDKVENIVFIRIRFFITFLLDKKNSELIKPI